MGQAFAGRGTTLGWLLTASSGLGWGRSATVILWRTPGFCWFQSVKAAWPVRTGPVAWAKAGCGAELRAMRAMSAAAGARGVGV